jgi:hypothetical protein
MKKIYFVLFLFISTKSFANSMISLDEYLNANSKYMDSWQTSNYVLGRCAAVNLYLAGITQNSPDKSIYNRALNLSKYFDELNFALLEKKAKLDIKAIENNILRNKASFSDNYAKDGQANYARTGEYTTNSYIWSDIQLCGELAKKK